jgi:hypothetical protein
VKIPGVPSVRLTVRSSLYVVAVAVIAAVGFTEQSAWPILFAALLAVPASIVAVPFYCEREPGCGHPCTAMLIRSWSVNGSTYGDVAR